MEFLAGLHPQIIHFPIVLFILYFVFELSGVILKKENISVTAYVILIAGVVAALAAVLTGNQAETAALSLTKSADVKNLIELHQDYATATLWFFAGVLVLRTYLMLKKKFTGSLKLIFIVLGLIGCYLVYETGNAGGALVFKHGVGTQFFGK